MRGPQCPRSPAGQMDPDGKSGITFPTGKHPPEGTHTSPTSINANQDQVPRSQECVYYVTSALGAMEVIGSHHSEIMTHGPHLVHLVRLYMCPSSPSRQTLPSTLLFPRGHGTTALI